MAIDTAEKRFSMMGFASIGLFAVPTGTVDAEERATFLNLYGGIALDVPPAEVASKRLAKSLTINDLVTDLTIDL